VNSLIYDADDSMFYTSNKSLLDTFMLLMELHNQSSGLQLGDLPAEVSYLSDLNKFLGTDSMNV
jgi:hypothetical protein